MRRSVIATVVLVFMLLPPMAAVAEERTDGEAEPSPAGAFSPTGPLEQAGGRNSAALLPDGRVFVIAGGSEGPSAAEVWDPATGRFGPAAWLTWGRFFTSATSLPDGRVLIVGGYPDTIGLAYPRSWDPLRVAETWDPARHRFEPAGILAQSRAGHTAHLLPGGQVLVVGGEFGESQGISAEMWDPATETFEAMSWLSVPRFGRSETVLEDGRILVVGGGAPFDLGRAPAEALLWDPTTGDFSPAGSLIETRLNHSATLLADGRVLVVGGWGEDEPLASAETWDPATSEFSPAGALGEARALHTATLLGDGRVLVIGGWRDEMGSYVTLASAEVWDPATGEFSPAGLLEEAREHQTATLLRDGRVLVIGGEGENGALSSAEVWTAVDQASGD